jgi:hypothetical protein
MMAPRSMAAVALLSGIAYGCSAESSVEATSGPARVSPVWAELIGDDNYQEPSAVAIGPDGQLAVVGNFAGGLSQGETQLSGDGTVDGFLLVFSATGALKWSAALVGPAEDALTTVAFLDGSIVVAGYASEAAVLAGEPVAGSAAGSAIVARFTTEGSLEWLRTFGGDGYQAVSSISPTDSGSLVIAGDFTSRLGLPNELESAGSSDSFVAELSAAGEVLWNASISSPGTEVVSHVTRRADGATVVTGTSDGLLEPESASDGAPVRAFVRAFDSTGTPTWWAPDLFSGTHSHGGEHLTVERAELLTSSSGNLVVGATRGQMFALHSQDFEAPDLGTAVIVGLDSEGQPRWRSEFSAHDAQIQLAGATYDELSSHLRLIGSFNGEMRFASGTLTSDQGRSLFTLELGELGELDNARLVDFSGQSDLGSTSITARASGVTSSGTTVVVAAVEHADGDRDILLAELPALEAH